MNFTHLFIEERYLEAIGWTLVHSVWQIALISMLLWLLLAMMQKKAAAWRYNMAYSALLLVFVAGAWTFLYELESAESNPPLAFSADIEVTAQTGIISASVISRGDFSNQKSLLPYISSQLEHYLPYLVNLWILGAMFYMIRLAGSLYDLEKLHKKHHEAVNNTLFKKIDNLSASLGIFRKVEVLKSSLVHSPVTYGLVKPVILLPTSLIFSISPEQLEAIIAHELAHIKRNDYLFNFIQSVMEVLFFFHPCFWWINHIIKEERENATDDLAISIGIAPSALAHGLAEVANLSNSPTPEMALAASEDKNSTLQRIKRILGKKTASPKLSPLFPLTMLFALIISSVLLVDAQVQEDRTDPVLLTSLQNYTVQADVPDDLEFTPISVNETRITRYNQDTIPSKKPAKEKEGMPQLQLTPAPQLDVQVLAFHGIPPAPPAPIAQFNFPPLDIKDQTDSLTKMALELQKLENDNSPEAQKRKEKLQASMEKVQENIEAIAQSFAEKISHWQDKNGLLFDKFEEDMKVWEEKMQKHQKEWESSFAPKMKEFEEKMKDWEKENAPKLKEYEEKMEIWMEENGGSFENKKPTNTHSFNHFKKYLPAEKNLTC